MTHFEKGFKTECGTSLSFRSYTPQLCRVETDFTAAAKRCFLLGDGGQGGGDRDLRRGLEIKGFKGFGEKTTLLWHSNHDVKCRSHLRLETKG